MIALAKCFSFRPDWHRQDRAIPLVQQYQKAVDTVLTLFSKRLCTTCCRHCGIRFLTHRHNSRRDDLHCPFGCRKHRQRECARRRSRKYYQTANGSKGKKALNGRRSCPAQGAPPREAPPTHSQLLHSAPTVSEPPSTEPPSGEPSHCEPLTSDQADTLHVAVPSPRAVPCQVSASIEGVMLDEEDVKSSWALSYVRMLVRVLEKIPVGPIELVEWLLQCLRSRSIAWKNRKTYALGFLHEHPP